MKPTLLASAACLVIGFAIPAHAVIPVTDEASILQRGIEAARSLAQMAQQYEVMRQQYDQLVQTYGALSHTNNVGGIAKNLMNQQMQSPGSAPNSIPGLAFGSQLSSGAAQFLNQNNVYTPQGDDFAALEMQRQAKATANLQAEAQMGRDRADERIASINELESCIDGQPDIQASVALQSRVQTEQLFLTNEQANVARLQLTQQLGARVDTQRAEQNGRKEAEDRATRMGASFNNGGF